jgi:F-type H+-transporting ATPase subunit gamma
LANQKEIRNRIGSVKNTQKITRAMKMIAGARLSRAQTRILEMRPYARQTAQVLRSVVGEASLATDQAADAVTTPPHPLLVVREQKKVALLVLTADRGLCGGFNSSLLRQATKRWKALEAEGKEVSIFVVGRKGQEYFARRSAPVAEYFPGVWDSLDLGQARRIAYSLLRPYAAGEVDAIVVIYNEFVSAMTQLGVEATLFPLSRDSVKVEGDAVEEKEYIFEPDKSALLNVLVPMYIEVTLLRALYESMASELGARMTAMDSATKNAKDMIAALTLKYNRARQAAITTELMEIIGGSEALNG